MVSRVIALDSKIPHLARAIADKQGLRNTNQSYNLWDRAVRARHFASSTTYSRNTKSLPSPTISRVPQTARVPPAASPSVPRRPSRLESDVAQDEAHRAQKRVRGMVVAFCIFGFAMGTYVTYLYVSYNNQIKDHIISGKSLPQDADVSSRWTQLGRDFDDEVEWSEWIGGIGKMRRKLAREAYGNVLEVSCGTGRNMQWYDLRPFDPTNASRRNIIKSLTLNDKSELMVGNAENKLENVLSRHEKKPTAKVDFVVGDAGINGVIPRPEAGYDTIIQTMGLCSMVDPVGFLKQLGRLCRQPGESSSAEEAKYRDEGDDGKGGRILLLEHGRSNFNWLNKYLDGGASLHADHYGCWWNKDVGRIVEQSGLEVEKIKRHHFGTTWEVVLRPRPT